MKYFIIPAIALVLPVLLLAQDVNVGGVGATEELQQSSSDLFGAISRPESVDQTDELLGSNIEASQLWFQFRDQVAREVTRVDDSPQEGVILVSRAEGTINGQVEGTSNFSVTNTALLILVTVVILYIGFVMDRKRRFKKE